MNPIQEIRIRRVTKFGAPVFAVTVIHERVADAETVCYGRIDDTFVTLARLFADAPPMSPSASPSPAPRGRSGTQVAVLAIVREHQVGITAGSIYGILTDTDPHATLKSVHNALFNLRKRGAVKREGTRPVTWLPVGQ